MERYFDPSTLTHIVGAKWKRRWTEKKKRKECEPIEAYVCVRAKARIFGYRQRWLFADKNQRFNGFPTVDNGNLLLPIFFFLFHNNKKTRETSDSNKTNTHRSIF